ncbi:MAG: TolC family protein, partial [Leptospirales bacterium]
MNIKLNKRTRISILALAALFTSPAFARDNADDGALETIGTIESQASKSQPNVNANSNATTDHALTSPDAALRDVLLDISAQHPRILERARELAARLAAANYKSSRYPDPGLGVAWSNYPYKKDFRLIDDQTPMTGIEISISQPIPFPGRLTLESKIADVDASASRLRLGIEKNLIAREFLGTLLEAQAVGETIELARSFTERIKIVSEVANTRYAVGKGDLTDVSKAGVRYAAFQDRVRNLEGSLRTRYRNLVYFLESDSMQEDGDGVNGFASPDDNVADETLATIAERLAPVLSGGRGLPEYVQNLLNTISREQLLIEHESLTAALAALEIDRQEKEKYLARMQYLPDFEVFASYRKRANIPNDPAQDEDFMSFGFKMRVP